MGTKDTNDSATEGMENPGTDGRGNSETGDIENFGAEVGFAVEK